MTNVSAAATSGTIRYCTDTRFSASNRSLTRMRVLSSGNVLCSVSSSAVLVRSKRTPSCAAARCDSIDCTRPRNPDATASRLSRRPLSVSATVSRRATAVRIESRLVRSCSASACARRISLWSTNRAVRYVTATMSSTANVATTMSALLSTGHLQRRIRNRLEAQRPSKPPDETSVSLDELVRDRVTAGGRVFEAYVSLAVAALQLEEQAFHYATGGDVHLVQKLHILREELVERFGCHGSLCRRCGGCDGNGGHPAFAHDAIPQRLHRCGIGLVLSDHGVPDDSLEVRERIAIVVEEPVGHLPLDLQPLTQVVDQLEQCGDLGVLVLIEVPIAAV